MSDQTEPSSPGRLDELWSGAFGDEYTERNRGSASGRATFWSDVLDGLEAKSILEVGCNRGENLLAIAGVYPEVALAGVDVNESALDAARADLPEGTLLRASAVTLPFEDRSFDLVFTTGVLIHIDPDDLLVVMSEIVRCSSRYVLCGEYYSDAPEEVRYRGNSGALFKRDFGSLYLESFPELELLRTGFLPKGPVWDDVTWWLFSRRITPRTP